jgi:hypothetical protein
LIFASSICDILNSHLLCFDNRPYIHLFGDFKTITKNTDFTVSEKSLENFLSPAAPQARPGRT